MKTVIAIFFLIISVTVHSQINPIIKSDLSKIKPITNYFRVVVKGFTCNRETADDILERDGKRDEVYLTSLSFAVNNTGFSLPSTVIKTRSRTLGDINARNPEENRAMAGTADGNLGGIKSGDNLPDAEPWKNNAPASGDLLPFVLWEGTLNPENGAAIIHPGIMEWDGPADFLTNLYERSFIGLFIKSIGTGIASLPFRAIGIGEGASYNESAPGIWPAPTVMQQYSDVFYKTDINRLSVQDKKELSIVTDKPADRPIGVDGSSIFAPLQIRINYNTASDLSSRDFGYGKGIVPVRYRDDEKFKGEYILYIAFENITDISQKNKMNIINRDVFDPLAKYTLRNAFASDKEADILNGGTVSNTHVVLNNQVGLISQKWKIKKANQFYFNITNQYNNLNLDILSKNDINGSNIVVSVPDGSETQQWAFIRYCDGSWLMRNVKTKRVAEVYNAATAFGSPLGQWDNTAAANQRWFIEK